MATRRSRGIEAPRQGIQRALIAPGVTPTPVAPPSARAQALQRLLGQAAGVAATGAQIAQTAHRKRVRDEVNADIDAAVKGMAAPAFKTREAYDIHNSRLAREAANRFDPETLTFQPGEDAGTVYERTYTASTAGLSAKGKLEYKERTLPVFTRWHQRKIRETQRNLVEDGIAGLSSSAADPDSEWKMVVKNYASLQKQAAVIGISESSLLGSVFVPALRAAAEAGNKERALQIAGMLKNVIPDVERQAEIAATASRAKLLNDAFRLEITRTNWGVDFVKLRKQIDVHPELDDAQKATLFSQLENRRVYKIRKEQKYNSEVLNVAIHTQAMTKEELGAEIERRRTEDPESPTFLQRGDADSKLRVIYSDELSGINFTLQKQNVMDMMNKKGRPTMLGPRDDDAILSVGIGVGILSGTATKPNGAGIMRPRIISRVDAARFFKDVGRIPSLITDSIQAAVASDDSAIVQEGILDFLYIWQEAPHQATTLLSKAGERARARMMAAHLEADANPFDLADTETVNKRISDMMPALMETEPSKHTRAESLNILFGYERLEFTEGRNQATAEAMGTLEDALPEEYLNIGRNWVARWFTGGRNAEGISPDMGSEYVDLYVDNYRAYLHVLPPEKAKEAAKKRALQTIAVTYQPFALAKDRIIFIKGMPNWGAEAGLGYKKAIQATASSTDEARRILATYRPIWSDSYSGLIAISELEDPGYGVPYTFTLDGERYTFVWRGQKAETPPRPTMELPAREPAVKSGMKALPMPEIEMLEVWGGQPYIGAEVKTEGERTWFVPDYSEQTQIGLLREIRIRIERLNQDPETVLADPRYLGPWHKKNEDRLNKWLAERGLNLRTERQ